MDKVKFIYRFPYLEKASPSNISILCIIVLFLVFILLSSIPPVAIVLLLSTAPVVVHLSPQDLLILI